MYQITSVDEFRAALEAAPATSRGIGGVQYIMGALQKPVNLETVRVPVTVLYAESGEPGWQVALSVLGHGKKAQRELLRHVGDQPIRFEERWYQASRIAGVVLPGGILQ